ncbi:MAG TPA: enoyl-CoA hydratase [Stellaceae bacterium]|jgi:enoyl-CoA hydratase/carnithine racemase|nr:enoyl-CoA hydratase [Stellaceae bacterium]
MSGGARAAITVRLVEHGKDATVAHLTVANPGKLNVVGRALMSELIAATGELAATAGLRAVVLRGDGDKAFIGGADISEMAELDSASACAFITQLHQVCDGLRRLPVPVIARIDGYALGAGLEIAASCDLRIASERAVLGMPEVRVGIPSVIEAALLPSLIGWGRTRRLLLTGETIAADEAQRWGLVERVVPAEALDDALGALLDAILACGANALRLQKELISYWEEHTISQSVARGIASFAEAWGSDEPRRLMQRFLDAKRAKRGDTTPS